MRKFNVTVNGNSYEVSVEELGESNISSIPVAPVQAVVSAPVAAEVPKPVASVTTTNIADGEKIVAPMPGTILDIKTSKGASVKKGDILLILEAMKMENEIVAPVDGKISQIITTKGASVNSGDLLLVIS